MKVFKSDNGGEFTCDELSDALLENRVFIQPTSPYTPHQNGVSERTNRTVFELAFTIMYAACVPIFLWPYACRTVIYVLDRLPTRATGMMYSAYALLNGVAADVRQQSSHIRLRCLRSSPGNTT